jgi:hypothetical protein
MACPRCQAETDGAWCVDCERAYDTWVRRHASDIIWASLAGTVIVTTIAIGLPLLGMHWMYAATSIFAGWGTIAGMYYASRRRRRRQFLRGGDLPRAYLPDRT